MNTPLRGNLEPRPPPDEVITFPNLIDFTWEFTQEGFEYDQKVFQCLSAPSLQKLGWMQEKRRGVSQGPEATFCQRLPTGLKHMEIEHVFNNDPDAVEEYNLLSVIPKRLQIESLSLVYGSFQALLDSASYLVPSEDRPNFMPFLDLTKLQLTSEDHLDCDRLENFLGIIRHRLKLRPHLHLTIMFNDVVITCTRADLGSDTVKVLESGRLTIVKNEALF
jgi:hypothetical protein